MDLFSKIQKFGRSGRRPSSVGLAIVRRSLSAFHVDVVNTFHVDVRIFRASRDERFLYGTRFVVRTPCHATRSFFRSGVRFPGPLACLQARGIRGLCHSPPRLEDQCGLWKNKTSMRKKPLSQWLEEKINLREEKIPDKPFQHAKSWVYR